MSLLGHGRSAEAPKYAFLAPRRPFGTGGALAAWGEGGGGEQEVEEGGPKNRPTATPGDSGTFGSGRVELHLDDKMVKSRARSSHG